MLQRTRPRRHAIVLLVLAVGSMLNFAAKDALAATSLPGFTETVYVSGLPASPAGLAIDQATRTLYLADANTTGILRKVAPEKSISTVTSRFSVGSGFYPYIATDIEFANGFVYSSPSNGELVKIDASTGASSIIHTSSGFGVESGMAIDGNKLYVTDGSGTSNRLVSYDLATKNESTVVSNQWC